MGLIYFVIIMGSGQAVYCLSDQMDFPDGSGLVYDNLFTGGTSETDPTFVLKDLAHWESLTGFVPKDWNDNKKAKGKLTIKNSDEAATLKKAVIHVKAGSDKTSKVEVDSESKATNSEVCDDNKKTCHITITCPNKKTAYPS